GQRHASGRERMARSSAELDHLARTQAPDDGQVRRIADLGCAGLDVEPVRRRQAEALALRVPEEDLHARHAHEGHRGVAHGAKKRTPRLVRPPPKWRRATSERVSSATCALTTAAIRPGWSTRRRRPPTSL